MSKFALELLNDVNGEIDFFKVLENAVCYWNEFCLEIESKTNWATQLDQLKARMDDVANKKLLPKEKFRKLKAMDDSYEVKTADLRAYLLLDQNGYIIMYAGKKSDQDKEIIKFNAIKERYLTSKEDVKRKTSK